MRIEDIDSNFKLETSINREGLRFLNAAEPPFNVHGLIRISDRWVRMPLDIAEKVNPGVYQLAKNTAGGRVRFTTDSPYVAISIQVRGGSKLIPAPLHDIHLLIKALLAQSLQKCTLTVGGRIRPSKRLLEQLMDIRHGNPRAHGSGCDDRTCSDQGIMKCIHFWSTP